MLGAKPLRSGSAGTTHTRNLGSRAGRALIWLACLGFSVNLAAALLLHLEASLDQPSLDSRAGLPNYQGADWAKTHFREFAELVTVHHSYVGWRRLPYRGETIEIDDDGIRRTYVDPAARPTKTIAFFGGSTMWGSGSDDDHIRLGRGGHPGRDPRPADGGQGRRALVWSGEDVGVFVGRSKS